MPDIDPEISLGQLSLWISATTIKLFSHCRPSLHGALLGCLVFLENPGCPPSLSQAQLLSVAKNLTSNVFVQHLPQTERLLAYRALQALVQVGWGTATTGPV